MVCVGGSDAVVMQTLPAIAMLVRAVEDRAPFYLVRLQWHPSEWVNERTLDEMTIDRYIYIRKQRGRKVAR